MQFAVVFYLRANWIKIMIIFLNDKHTDTSKVELNSNKTTSSSFDGERCGGRRFNNHSFLFRSCCNKSSVAFNNAINCT